MSTSDIEEANEKEIEDVNSAATSLSTPITSEELARQIKAASDPLKRQLKKLCDLMLELRRDTSRRNEGTSPQSTGLLGHVARDVTVV